MKIPPFFCPHASSGANTRVFSVLHTSLTISHLHHPNNPYRPFRLSKEPLSHPQKASFTSSKSLFHTPKKPLPHPQKAHSTPSKSLFHTTKKPFPNPQPSSRVLKKPFPHSHPPTFSPSHPFSLPPPLTLSRFPLSIFFTSGMNKYTFQAG